MRRRQGRENRLPIVALLISVGVILSFVLHWIILAGSGAVVTFLLQTPPVAAQNFFYSKILVPHGTDPTADADGDILTFFEFDGTIGITGADSSVTGNDVIGWFVRQEALFYNTILNDGIALPQTGALNFTGAGVTCTDEGVYTQCSISGPDGTGYDTVQDSGTGLTQRGVLNFTGAGVTCTDDAGNVRTNCDVPGGGGAGDVFKTIDVPVGTDPVASGAEDILTLVSGDSTVTITGSSTTNTVDFTVEQALLDFYSTIQVSGSSLDQRRILNFLGSLVVCEDNPGTESTDCTIETSGSGVQIPITETVFKSQDEVVNNSNVFQDDDELTIEIGGDGQVWAFKAVIYYDSSAAADFKMLFSCPPGNGFSNRTDAITIIADCGGVTTIGTAGVGSIIGTTWYGLLDTTATGTLKVQWAQATAEATDTTVRRGSYLKVLRLDATQEVGGPGGGPHAISHAESGSDPLFSQHGLGLGQTGTVATGSDVNNVRVPVFNTFTIKDVRCRVRVAPAGADIVIDAFKNGTTIFTTTANRPTILAGQLEGVSATPDITSITIGDFFNIQVIQVGSSIPGEDLVCVTRLRQALYDSD